MTKRRRRRPVSSQRIGTARLTIQRCNKGDYAFCVTVHENGRRSEKYFKTAGEAKAHSDAKANEITSAGTRAATQISDGDRRGILEFLDATAAWPDPKPSVPDALRWFVREHRAISTAGTVTDAVKARMDDANRRGLSGRHCDDVRLRLSRFEQAFGSRAVRSITAEEISQWLDGLGVGAQSRVNYHRVVSSVFELAVRRGQIDRNPLTAIGKAKVVRDEPAILTPGQVGALLGACGDEIRAAIAIQAFAGLRRAEVERLDWNEVDFEHEVISISAGKAKTASRRLAPMRPNLVRWLLPLARPAGPVCPSPWIYRVNLEQACTAAKISEWPVNVLRHSAATYLLADTEDSARVSAWLGHSPAVLHSNYRAIATKADAAEYWQIVPGDRGKVVDLEGKAAAS